MWGRKFSHRVDRECSLCSLCRLAILRHVWRRVFLAIPLAAFLAVGSARAEESYSIDQTFGSIMFSVSHLGLFSSQGQFRRFRGTLLLDASHPEWTRISVDVESASANMSSQEETAMLQSPDFFNVQKYPDVHFESTSVEPVASNHYVVRGQIEIRGITQPLILDAKLVARHEDPARGAEVAEFVVTGTLQRSAFGMTADRAFISDKVAITINARIQLSETFRAN
ncbi:MAG TPA: YceI family protein [Acetobacteraceae bacterium]